VSEAPQLGGGNRVPWAGLPDRVRDAIETVLGAPVGSAVSQAGGFSPGSADRVATTDGRRAFVKAVSRTVNPDAPSIYLQEARVLPLLPDGLPVARLLGVVEEDGWIALVLEDIDGRHPAVPWRADELHEVLDALHAIGAAPVPPALASALEPLPDAIASLFSGWTAVTSADLAPLPSHLAVWCTERLDDLRRLAAEGLDVIAGGRLVHLDVRADNLLIRPDGAVAVLDWPWAAIGAPWFDALTLLINVRLYDPGHDVDAALAHPAFAGMPSGAVERVLAGMAGFFIPASLQPAPPGLPTLRTFQRDQGVATLEWLRQRW
jgi:aminoglycoside phosphotransferase (APT) family kinase protein